MKKEKKPTQVQLTDKKVEESLSYTVEVRDKKGQVLQRISAPSRSYVEQWNQLINILAKQSAAAGLIDTGGVVRSISPDPRTFGINALAGNILKGIRVGKGFTAVAIDDYALETPLGEGVGVDEFNHQAMTHTAPVVVGTTSSFPIKRILINNSGATISDIREISCYIGGQNMYFLGFRDVLPGAVAVPDGGSITVTYTIAATV